LAEANYIDASKVHGEKFTGFELADDKGPFECGNCEYYRGGWCVQETMMAKSEQPKNAQGLVKVEPHACCEYVERLGKKKRPMEPARKGWLKRPEVKHGK